MYQILIVDDEPMAIKACQHALPWADFGMNPRWTVLNPLEGLELLKTQMMDVCFVDIRMPELNGFEFIQEARKIQPELLFIILTGYDQYDYVREAFKENAFDYCLKPIQRAEAGSLLPRIEDELFKIRIERDGRQFGEEREVSDLSLDFRVEPHKRYFPLSIEMNDPQEKSMNSSFIRRQFLSIFEGFHLVESPHVLHLLIPVGVDENSELQYEALSELLTGLKERISFIYFLLKEPINLQQLSLIWKAWLSYGVRHKSEDIHFTLHQLLDLQDDRIERALLLIHRDYSQDLSLRFIADELGMNYSYFSELFSKATGQSFTQYLNAIRLNASKELLVKTDLSISDIAYQVGYNSEQYFSRLFRKQFEMSPSNYRKEAVSGEAEIH